MKTILIDKNFLKMNSAESTGLISGLKKLSVRFDLYVNQPKTIDKTVAKLLQLENVEFKDATKLNSFNYEITKGKSKKKNALVVGTRSKISTFDSAAELIISRQRSANVYRKTKETEINITVELDGTGKKKIKTGVGFFDHMLDQIARHANVNLFISVKGDLHVDEHHIVEDTGIALGEAIRKALGNKLGIKRYGYFLPMDDSIAVCALDLGGRAYSNFNCKFTREKVGDFPTELTEEFFRALAGGLGANLYLKAQGKNDHHKIEALFKAFAKSLNEACRIDERAKNSLPSTKGML